MGNLGNRLKPCRQAAGLTQQALAQLAGVSRQAYLALESGAAAPSTEVALRLARALRVSVETLFYLADNPAPIAAELPGSAGWNPASAAPQRARLAQVGQRLFAWPLRRAARPALLESDGLIVGAAEPGRAMAAPFDVGILAQPALVLAGCDPAVALLEPALARRGVRLVWNEESSQQALMALARGEAHVAGCHLKDPATGRFNHAWAQKLVPFPCVLVTFAVWQQGFMVAPGNPKGIRAASDLGRPGVRLVNRQSGSGSRNLLERLLRADGVPFDQVGGFHNEAEGHLAVAQAVAAGQADVGVGVAAAAGALGLDFIPLEEERYDLVIPRRFLDEPGSKALLDLLRQPGLARQVEALGGYDVAGMGQPAAA